MRLSMLKRDWALALAPKELSGRPEGFIFACLCMAVLVLVAIADARTHQYGTVGGIAFIPVLAAAWLLSDRMTAAVAGVAMSPAPLGVPRGAVGIRTVLHRLIRILLL